MAESPTLNLADLQLDEIRLLDQNTFQYIENERITRSTNTLATLTTISGYTPGWYLISMSYGAVSSAAGSRMLTVMNGENILVLSGGSNIAGGGEDIDIVYLDGSDITLEYGRNSSEGGVAYFANISLFGLLLSTDPEGP